MAPFSSWRSRDVDPASSIATLKKAMQDEKITIPPRS